MITLEDFRPKSRALYGLDEHSDLTGYLSDRACTNAMQINLNERWRLDDKAILTKTFQEYTDRIVPTHGLLLDGAYHPLDTDEGLMALLKSGRAFVVKPAKGTSGKSVSVVQMVDWADPGWVERTADELLRLEDFVVTEWVEQAGSINRIWPASANTIRVLTMRPNREPSFVAGAVQRFGNETSGNADNWSLGGLCASVLYEEGALGFAASQHGEDPPVWHRSHPDTGIEIFGTRVPYWEETKALALHLADHLLRIPYVGWDFVITEDGPILLEANGDPGVHIHQVHGGLLMNERVREFYLSHGVDGVN